MGGGSGCKSAVCWIDGPEWLQPAWHPVPQVGLCHRGWRETQGCSDEFLNAQFRNIHPHRYPYQHSPNDNPLHLGPSPSMSASGSVPTLSLLLPLGSVFGILILHSGQPIFSLPGSQLLSTCLTDRSLGTRLKALPEGCPPIPSTSLLQVTSGCLL